MSRLKVGRRRFLKSSVVASAAVWTGLSRRASGYQSPNERPRLGLVGCGSRWGWLLANGRPYGVGPQFAPMGDYVVVCDVDDDRTDAAKRLVKDWNGRAPESTDEYRAVLERDDLDAVLCFTPDHWHAKVAIEAMLAGKDVYCEKPMTLTIDEGRKICDVAKRTKCVFQVGTQQRSMRQFLVAVALIRAGRIGKIQRVECGVGGGPTSPEIPVAEAPSNFNFERWLGPAPKVDYRYLAGAQNETKSWSRCHYEFRWWYEYSGGKLTDWGAHHVDIATWGLDKMETGPVSVDPVMVEHPVPLKDGYPTVDDRYNTATKFDIRATYADGVELAIKHDARNGILFEGTEGRVFVNRGGISGGAVDALKDDPLPDGALEAVYKGRPLDDANANDDSTAHVRCFFAALADRGLPASDVFSHHRALTTCHLAGIAARLGRKIQWNPETETVVDDPLAQSLVAREKRKGYEIELG